VSVATVPAQVHATRSWRALLPPATLVRLVILAGLVLFAYWRPIRTNLVGKWLHDGNWSHGWLIPLFSLYFLSTRRDELLRCRPAPNYWGAAILALSLAVYFVSAWQYRMVYPQLVSIVGVILGLTLLLGGLSVIRTAWFPILFLLFAIPLPQAMYVELTMPLRRAASLVAATVMPLFVDGLHTEAQAVIIDYCLPGRPPGQLNVEEACSGMRSIMAFVTLGVAIAYVRQRPWWHRALMLVSCVPIAVFCNAIRVTTTGLLFVTGHDELARGTPHALLGVLMFGIALGSFLLIDYVLGHLWVEVSEDIAVGDAV